MVQPPIPVLCDRCAARGEAGGVDFTLFGDLLEFEPVPRRTNRADGWTPAVQRTFIAALALTGSERQAAHAVGKAAYGVTQLKKAEGNEGFMAAHARALAFYEAEHGRRLSEGLLAAGEHAAHNHGRAPALPWSGAASRRGRPANAHLPRPAPEPERELTEGEREERKLAHLESIFDKFILKVQAERQARLDGDIVAADHYCRQMTVIEVMLDLAGGWELQQAIERKCGFHLVDIAATPLSLLFDEVRREKWAELGEPERPPPPSHDELVERDGFYTAKGNSFMTTGNLNDFFKWQRDRDGKERRAAEAQVAWEAKAIVEAAAWRARVEAENDPPRNGEGDQL